jgi:hypothetical protein
MLSRQLPHALRGRAGDRLGESLQIALVIEIARESALRQTDQIKLETCQIAQAIF